MKIFFIVSFLLGSLVVFQPSLNRMIFEQRGLSFAVLLNGAVLFCVVSLLFLSVSLAPERFPEMLRYLPNRIFSWWYVLPGIMGFLLVVLVPILIKEMGAFLTIVTMILGQVATSFLWDMYQGGTALGSARLLGLILVMSGVYLSFRPSV